MDIKECFALEKYKYVLARKQDLNDATFKIAAMYQALIIGVGVAQYSVLKSFYAQEISSSLAKQASLSLMGMLLLTSLLIISLLVGGVFSWLKYRGDESTLANEFLGKSKDNIKLVSIFSWYETYLVLVVFLVAVVSVIGYWNILFPIFI